MFSIKISLSAQGHFPPLAFILLLIYPKICQRNKHTVAQSLQVASLNTRFVISATRRRSIKTKQKTSANDDEKCPRDSGGNVRRRGEVTLCWKLQRSTDIESLDPRLKSSHELLLSPKDDTVSPAVSSCN